MVEPSAALGIIQGIRSKYPTPLSANHAAFLLEVAAACQCGLLKKDTGTNILLPDGTRVAQDILMDGDQNIHYDILSDGEGAAIPVFNSDGPMDHGRFYPVTPSEDHKVPDDKPPVDTGDNPLDAVLTKLRADMDNAHGRIAQLETGAAAENEALLVQVKGLQEQITSVASRDVVLPPLEVKFSLLGRQLTLPVTERK